MDFAGFPPKTLRFLRSIRSNNGKKWFDAHRADYETAYVEPAIAFVSALAVRLPKLAPVVVDARINGSIRRINRDTRFSKDKQPYKDHLDFSFWEGERNNGMSSFFVRVSPDHFVVGAGFHGGDSNKLRAYRQAVADQTSGRALAGVAKKIRGKGYELGGVHFKRMPKGFEEGGPAAEFLLHNGLFAVHRGKPAQAQAKDVIDQVVGHCKTLLPLHRWLVDRTALE